MSEYRYSIVADPDHGYLRVDPLPSEEEVAKFYMEEFYATIPPERNDSALASQDDSFNNVRFDLIRTTVEEIVGPLSKQRLLDIGCGYCQAILYFAEYGAQVRGIDPAPEAIRYGRERGLKVRQASVEDDAALGEGGPYDIVLLLNVLEHLRRPGRLLEALKTKVIKSTGLLIIDVPNEYNDFQVTADEEYFLNQWWVAPPNHINYFSPDSLKSLLASCGYNVHAIEGSFPMEMFLLMGECYVGNTEIGRACHLKRVKFEQSLVRHGRMETLRRFYSAIASCGLGRQITLYASPA